MPATQLGQFEDSFVIHFGTKSNRINAYTLASTLAGIADAAKAANDSLNPGFDIEVVVEAIGRGSFKARIRSYYHNQNNLFSGAGLKAIVLNIISTFIYIHTLQPDPKMNVIVTGAEVVIEHGSERIVIPRVVHDAAIAMNSDTKFCGGATQVIRSVSKDNAISSLGFTSSMTDKVPSILIPRERFQYLAETPEAELPQCREVIEPAEITILRAVLSRSKSKRRWQFVMGGIRISAPILDSEFYRKFTAHEIRIAPGDQLQVRLKIKQKFSIEAGIYINEGYEITEVIDHIQKVVEIQSTITQE